MLGSRPSHKSAVGQVPQIADGTSARYGQDASAVDDGATSRAMRLALLISAMRKS